MDLWKFKVLLASLGPGPWLSELPHYFTDLSLLCRQVETKEVPGGRTDQEFQELRATFEP